MFLARREFGKAVRVYPLRSPMPLGRVATFTPILGDGANPPRRVSTLSIPGVIAIAETRERALAMVRDNEDELALDLL